MTEHEDRVREFAADLSKYAADYADALTWGGPTIYPRHPVDEKRAAKASAVLTGLLSEFEALTAERDGLREGVKTLATQAEHGSFTACMAADPETLIVALGEQFVAIKDKARALLTPPAPHSDGER